MNEETMKILKMLEEGKIKADEAAKLIEAVGHRRHFVTAFSPPDKIGETVSEKVREAMHSVHDVLGDVGTKIKQVVVGESQIDAEAKSRIVIKILSGDVSIEPSDGKTIEAEGGLMKKEETDDELILKSLSGDIKLRLPKIDKVSINVLSGDISGKIKAKDLKAKTLSGDIYLHLAEIENGEFKSKSGDIALALPVKGTNLSIEAEVKTGDIDCDLPLKNEEKGDGYLKGVLNSAKGKLVAKTLAGDIELRKA